MRWRFADLPVRTKFLITIGIPVLGLVLLIGKQVDSSIKRRNVTGYIEVQSHRMGSLANALHELQWENELGVSYLTGRPLPAVKLSLQFNSSDAAIDALQETPKDGEPIIDDRRPFSELFLLRQAVMDRRIDAADATRAYRRMNGLLLDELGRVGKLALDPETKDRLYAHLRLLSAKEALSEIRAELGRGFVEGGFREDEVARLAALVSQYETNMLLFERDAPPGVLNQYRQLWQGPEVNSMRSIIGTVREKRSVAMPAMPMDQWWDLSKASHGKLKEVEDLSLLRIKEANRAEVRSAELRLLVVVVALLGVITAVAIMAFVIMRGIRNTVEEVGRAADALARGDIRVKVAVDSSDEVGMMAGSFNRMIENIRSLAASADAIGKGNFDTKVDVRSAEDVLGIALTRMKENLQAARERDMEQNRALQEEKEKLQRANDRIQVLIKEIHHRVKNNLQVIASLLRLQASTITDEHLQSVFDQSQSRVSSMALIHEKLYKGDELASLDVTNYIEELFSELVRLNDVREAITHEVDIAQGLSFGLDTMVPMGLILNELITNSFKHAFTAREQGHITLSIQPADGSAYDLVYADDGIGLPGGGYDANGGTLGLSLVESLVDQLDGHFTVESSPQGTRYQIRFRAR